MHKMEMKNLLQIFIIWIILLTLLIGFYFLVLLPQAKRIDSLSREIDQKSDLYFFANKLINKDEIDKIEKQKEQVIAVLKSFIVGYDKAESLAFDISNIAAHSGLKDFAITNSTSNEASEKEFSKIDIGRINLKFNSGFTEFARFINLLEKNQPVVFVDKFTIELIELNSNTNPVSMSLECFINREQDRSQSKS